MFLEVRPYLQNKSFRDPDSPNVSSMPILFINAGSLSLKNSATAPPRHPIILWFSTVTICPVYIEAFNKISLSIGLIVCK